MIKKSLFYCFQYFSTFVLLITNIGAANKIPDFETTRLKSTAGAGVASFLMDEATILNPAPLSFFNNGSVYLQKSGGKASTTNNPITKSSDQLSVITSDTKGAVKGSLSYISQDYRANKRKRFSISAAHIGGKKSSFGVTHRFTKDTLSDDGNTYREDKYNQTIFGMTHALNSNFALGLVFIDPFKKKESDTKGIIGLQYLYQDYISLMLDGGADYSQKLGDTALWRTAMQIKMFTDFYLRFGIFNDKGQMRKGTGAGVGWVQPRLVLDFAIKTTNVLESQKLTQISEEIKETSFSLSYRF